MVSCCGEVAHGRAFFRGVEMINEGYQNTQLYLGIDGGGSKCKAVIYCSQNGVLGSGVAGHANVSRNYEEAMNNVLKATYSALENAKLPLESIKSLVAGIGAAGLNLDNCIEQVEQWAHPFKRAFFASDLHIACLGAHNGKEGAVIIAGTGTCGISVSNEKVLELGGHGFPAGDKGGGAWLGLSAIKYTLKALDGIEQLNELTASVLSQLKVCDGNALTQVVTNYKPADYAAVAPIVLDLAERTEPVSLDIVKRGAEYLSAMAERLLICQQTRLCLVGGVAPYMLKRFPDQIKVRVQPTKQSPEMGAVLFAQNKFKSYREE